MSKRDRYQFDDDEDQDHAAAPVSKGPLKVTAGDIFPGTPPPPPVPFRKPQGGAILKDGQLSLGAFTLTGTGLQVLPDQVTQADWQKVGELLLKLEGAIQWLIGDWLAYGEDVKWGEIPDIAEALGREPSTLHEYTYVARTVQFSIRMQNLSFGHHQLVAPLTHEQQVFSLEYASENKLSVANFRKWIKDQKGDAEPPRLPEGDRMTYKFVSSQFDKLRAADPSKAKPQEREQAQQISAEMQREIDAFNRKWGI